MKERLLELIHYKRNERDWDKRWDFPYAGDTSVFDREKIPLDQEISLFPTAFNASEIVRRQNGKT